MHPMHFVVLMVVSVSYENKIILLCYCWFSHDVTKIQTTKLSILPRFYFNDVLVRVAEN